MVNVLKASGQIEPFSQRKVRNSIKRAGISDELANQVLSQIKNKLYDNIPTSEIYRYISEFLAASQNPYTKAKYSLKQAIMSLGPTGYPFEDYVACLLKTQGYTTEVRSILPGKCVKHEIDVIAQKQGKKIMIEAKFHNQPGIQSDIHVVLYTKARFDDIKELHHFDEVWLVTNTKATQDAIDYGACSSVKIISWSFPLGESLRELVEKTNLAPITALTTLSQNQMQQLLNNHIVLCKEIVAKPSCLDLVGVDPKKRSEIISEASFVANTKI